MTGVRTTSGVDSTVHPSTGPPPSPFNGDSRFAIWAARHYHGTQWVVGLIRSPGFDDPRQPERWDPRLHLVKEILLTREPEVAQFPPALRWFTRLSAHSTAWSRKGTTVLHYCF